MDIRAGTFNIHDKNENGVLDEGDVLQQKEPGAAFFSQSTRYISPEVAELKSDYVGFDASPPTQEWAEKILFRWAGRPVKEIAFESLKERADLAATYGDLKALRASLKGVNFYAGEAGLDWSSEVEADLLKVGLHNCLYTQADAASLAYDAGDTRALEDAVYNLKEAHKALSLSFDEPYYNERINRLKLQDEWGDAERLANSANYDTLRESLARAKALQDKLGIPWDQKKAKVLETKAYQGSVYFNLRQARIEASGCSADSMNEYIQAAEHDAKAGGLKIDPKVIRGIRALSKDLICELAPAEGSRNVASGGTDW